MEKVRTFPQTSIRPYLSLLFRIKYWGNILISLWLGLFKKNLGPLKNSPSPDGQYFIPLPKTSSSTIPYELLQQGYLTKDQVERNTLWKWYKGFHFLEITLPHMRLEESRTFVWKKIPEDIKQNSFVLWKWLMENVAVPHHVFPLLPYQVYLIQGSTLEKLRVIQSGDLVLCIGETFQDSDLKKNTEWVKKASPDEGRPMESLEEILVTRPKILKDILITQEPYTLQDDERTDHIFNDVFKGEYELKEELDWVENFGVWDCEGKNRKDTSFPSLEKSIQAQPARLAHVWNELKKNNAYYGADEERTDSIFKDIMRQIETEGLTGYKLREEEEKENEREKRLIDKIVKEIGSWEYSKEEGKFLKKNPPAEKKETPT